MTKNGHQKICQKNEFFHRSFYPDPRPQISNQIDAAVGVKPGVRQGQTWKTKDQISIRIVSMRVSPYEFLKHGRIQEGGSGFKHLNESVHVKIALKCIKICQNSMEILRNYFQLSPHVFWRWPFSSFPLNGRPETKIDLGL